MSFKDFLSNIKTNISVFFTGKVGGEDPMIGLKKFLRYLLWAVVMAGVTALITLVPSIGSESIWAVLLSGVAVAMLTSAKKMFQAYEPEKP